MKSPAILFADDHTILLKALQAFLTPEFDVIGTVTDGRALVNETPSRIPHRQLRGSLSA